MPQITNSMNYWCMYKLANHEEVLGSYVHRQQKCLFKSLVSDITTERENQVNCVTGSFIISFHQPM